MNERQILLLQTINSALEFKSGIDQLFPDEVNCLGARLGFEPQQILQLVENLQQAKLLELDWLGKVSITNKGKSALRSRESSATHVNVEAGGVYIGPNAQIGSGAAVGPNAMAAGALRIEQQPPLDLTAIVGGLVAAHQNLIHEQSSLPAEAQLAAQQLAQETNSIRQEMQNPAINRTSVEQRLDRAKSILEKLGGITAAATSLKPVLEFLRHSFNRLATYLQNIVP